MADVEKLNHVLRDLVNNGNTVVVIEHNMDVILASDWVIDLGPEGGDEGGNIVAEGPPHALVRKERLSYTCRYIRRAIRSAG